MVYWKCPGLCTFFFKTSTWYILFMLYYAVIMTFRDSLEFVHVNAKTVLWWLKNLSFILSVDQGKALLSHTPLICRKTLRTFIFVNIIQPYLFTKEVITVTITVFVGSHLLIYAVFALWSYVPKERHCYINNSSDNRGEACMRVCVWII